MCFSLDFLVVVLESIDTGEKKAHFLKYFNNTGSGGWLLYKMCSNLEWRMQGSTTQEVASQMLCHSIFGTYKKDLSILSQISSVGNWYIREQMGNSFRNMTSGVIVGLKPPKQKIYAKMSCASQTELL